MHRGCLATPASCSVIDSQRDLYITDRQLTRAGQWCVPCFWLQICVLNSHGPPAGWHKTDGSSRAAFLIGSTPGRPCMSLFLFLSILQWRGGWGEKSRNSQKERDGEWVNRCVEMWLMCQQFRIPPTTQTPRCWIQGSSVGQTLTSKFRHAAEELNEWQRKTRLTVQSVKTAYKLATFLFFPSSQIYD